MANYEVEFEKMKILLVIKKMKINLANFWDTKSVNKKSEKNWEVKIKTQKFEEDFNDVKRHW